MTSGDLINLPISELAPLLRNRTVSPVEATSAYLKRIGELNDKLKAFITADTEGAMSAARVAETEMAEGKYRGPLHGVPVSLKDLFRAKGLLTTNGSLAYKDSVPDEDATVVSRLRDAGAVILGKDNLYGFAMGLTVQPPYGMFRNPWGQEHSPGGSSSGTGVAVPARMSAGGLGSDTGGSIRIPASYCGLVGPKPTWGLVSDYGAFPLSYSLDTAGPITRTAEDAALLLQAIAGHDPRATVPVHAPQYDYQAGLPQPVQDLRLGVAKELFPHPDLDTDVQQSVQTAMLRFEELGCSLQEVSIPQATFAPAIYTGIAEPEVVSRKWDDLVGSNGGTRYQHADPIAGIRSDSRKLYVSRKAGPASGHRPGQRCLGRGRHSDNSNQYRRRTPSRQHPHPKHTREGTGYQAYLHLPIQSNGPPRADLAVRVYNKPTPNRASARRQLLCRRTAPSTGTPLPAEYRLAHAPAAGLIPGQERRALVDFILGCDIGGTFTDFVVFNTETGESLVDKCLTTPGDPAQGVMHGIANLKEKLPGLDRDTGIVIHATTLTANAVLERKGSATTLLCTRGFPHILAARRHQRVSTYELFADAPPPLVPQRQIFEVSERTYSDGRILTPVAEDEVRALARELREDAQVESVAIVFLHSYANPHNEQEAARVLVEEWPEAVVSLSSDVLPEFREYE